MKKILILMGIIGILFIPQITLAVTVSVSNASGSSGQKAVAVTISAADMGKQEIYGIDLQLSYDEKLIKPTDVTLAKLTSGWNLVYNLDVAGKINIAIYGIKPLPRGRGGLAKVSFDILTTDKPKGRSNLTISKAKFNASSAKRINNGTFKIKAKRAIANPT